MSMNLNSISQLPTPYKFVGGIAGGGLILSISYVLLGDSPNKKVAMLIIAGGMALVYLIFLGFKALVGWFKKRKASPLSQSIAGNAAAAPQGVSEPARRARLDDLRRNFEQGVEKFRAAGKNIYSVPWYVLVGEPGSGKTEAIRHCNVGFPPGLQDQLQGAGGTLNMNWWFTNAAIILDTAGRLMFEEVVPGTTNEWLEFLNLLKRNRPNCPINGMLLVIPVDTLIKDSADAIEKKAGKIAQQFDQIQRTLGVRFPVFVIITKCDLLNGFREFFDDLNDPQMQHQIMGWSNPSPLDERFDPAQVTNHLEVVKQRLVERRQNLLLDPVHTEDPQARRIEQVDALYAMPDSITKIGPRLRRYLEMIFVAGEWSPKPLFLRGIYFTSSMTEGAALDAELAEVLGVPVDSLPGAGWHRDRAYFLRDLFLEKVFREKGLVTRASNADKQQRTRRAVVLAFGFIAVIALFAVTYFSSRSLEKSIGSQRNWWDTAAKLDLNKLQLIDTQRGNAYAGEADITIGSKAVSLAQLYGDNLQQVRDDVQIPAVFKPLTRIAGEVNQNRRGAYRAMFERTVLRPIFEAARAEMPHAAENWDPAKGTAALAQLMKLEYAAAMKHPVTPQPGDNAYVELEPLVAFIYAAPDSAENLKKFEADKDNLQKVADWIYSPEAGGDKAGSDGMPAWPPKIASPGTPASMDAIKAGVDATINYWKNATADNGKALESIKTVRDALNSFREAEAALATATKGQNIDKMDVYRAYRDVWKVQMDKLRDASKRASEAWATATGGKPETESLRKLYEDAKIKAGANAQKTYDMLLAYTPTADAAKDNNSLSAQGLLAARAELEKAKADISAWNNSAEAKATLDDLSALDAAYFGKTIKGLDKNDHHRFEVHEQLYELADKMVVKDDASVTLTGSLADAFQQADKDTSEAVSTLKQPLLFGGDALTQAGALAQFTVESSGRAKKYLLADAALANMPDTADKWEKSVQAVTAKLPGGAPDSLRRPSVPLVTFAKDEKLADDDKIFSPLFTPDVAGGAADKLETIRKLASLSDAATRILDPVDLSQRAAAAQKGFSAYRDQYIQYWRDTARDELKFNFAHFSDFAGALVNVTEPGINGALQDYGKKMMGALERIGASDEANNIKSAPRVVPDECKTALSRWGDLGNDPQTARRIVLRMEATAFRSDFFVATARTSDSYIAHYWRDLPIAALNSLAADGRKEIEDSRDLLAKYERFPLAPPGDKKDDLTLAEVVQARTALEKVRGVGTGVTAAATGTAKLIGQGANTSIADIDSILVRLRGTDLFRDKQEYYDKIDSFLAALPSDNKPLSATLSVDKKKLAEAADSLAGHYSYMPISQDNKLLHEANLISANPDEATIQYPGGDLKFEFRFTPGGKIELTDSTPGQWAIFRLMKSPNVKTITHDGNKWSIEYVVTATDNKKPYSLWLNVEFKQPVPDLKDWPVPPGAGGK